MDTGKTVETDGTMSPAPAQKAPAARRRRKTSSAATGVGVDEKPAKVAAPKSELAPELKSEEPEPKESKESKPEKESKPGKESKPEKSSAKKPKSEPTPTKSTQASTGRKRRSKTPKAPQQDGAAEALGSKPPKAEPADPGVSPEKTSVAQKAEASEKVPHHEKKAPPKKTEEKPAPATPTLDDTGNERLEESLGDQNDTEITRELTPEELAAEERRAAELTRTVRVSIEQIMARTTGQDAEKNQEYAAPLSEPEEPAAPLVARLGQGVGNGLLGMLKWLLLVIVLVLLIAGAGVAWLYRSATPDMLPQFAVTLDGQELAVSSYQWHVPVVGDLFKRTFSATLNNKATVLADTVEEADPTLRLSASGYEGALTITDSGKTEIFSGSLDEFDEFSFTENGDYTGKLVVSKPESRFSDSGDVTGSQTYRFAFHVNIRPHVTLNTLSVNQGGVLAVRVTGIPADDVPALDSDFPSPGFVQNGGVWVAYLPIARTTDPGQYEIGVKTQGYDQTQTVTVRAGNWLDIDYTSKSKLTTPYLGSEETPQEVLALLDTCDTAIAWKKSGFVQPFLNSITVTLPYGATEYVGRTATQRAHGGGSGRTALNAVITGKKGDTLISPADGRVLLAQDLGGTAGNTLVIEHGAGLKSIFYNLRSLSVTAGQTVVRGQTLAAANKTTIAEVRLGAVPVEPLSIWRGQCDAVKVY